MAPQPLKIVLTSFAPCKVVKNDNFGIRVEEVFRVVASNEARPASYQRPVTERHVALLNRGSDTIDFEVCKIETIDERFWIRKRNPTESQDRFRSRATPHPFINCDKTIRESSLHGLSICF